MERRKRCASVIFALALEEEEYREKERAKNEKKRMSKVERARKKTPTHARPFYSLLCYVRAVFSCWPGPLFFARGLRASAVSVHLPPRRSQWEAMRHCLLGRGQSSTYRNGCLSGCVMHSFL